MNKKTIIFALILLLFIGAGFAYVASLASPQSLQTVPASAKEIAPTIVTDGSITSSNIATLHFPTGGKMVALYAKEGDKVYAGQSIAQLDTYALQQQLTAALNTYRSTRDSFDQTQQNANTNSILSN
ncbi:MAG: biotin/lipoyl-binding protein, partial [Patescibacteria group bacterium]|nr:biotin/lipoyl-binding protein [Patescibacteria group bacterium]